MTSQELASVLRAFTTETEISKPLFEFLEATASIQTDMKKIVSALTTDNSAAGSRREIKSLRERLKASEKTLNKFSSKPILVAVMDLCDRLKTLCPRPLDTLGPFATYLERFTDNYGAFLKKGGPKTTIYLLSSSALVNDWLTIWKLSAKAAVETLDSPTTQDFPRFAFERKRGVIWVCDLENSTKLMNDDAKVADVELFFPRLHWLATRMVACVGAQFVKWTGDGFLAWSPAELQRDVSIIAARLVEAACKLSHLVIGTSLGAGPEGRFRLRHAITLEQDTVLTTIEAGGVRSFDIIGRGVVLAFRLAGMEAEPARRIEHKDDRARKLDKILRFLKVSILTDVPISINPELYHRRKITAAECLKYFKGESFGTKSIWYYTGSAGRKSKDVASVISRIDEDMAKKPLVDFRPIHEALQNDVDWGLEVLRRNDVTEARVMNTHVIAYNTLKEIQRVVADHAHPKKPHRGREKP